MTRTKSTYLALLAILLSPIAAQANPIGDTVTLDNNFDFLDGDVVVGNGIEWDIESIALDIYADGFSFFVRFNSCGWSCDGTPWIMTISDIDWVGEIGQIVGIEWVTTFNFFESISVTGDSVTWRIEDGPHSINDRLDVRWTVSHNVPHNVPEPGTLALLGIGLAGMGLARRRRKI